jgi:hypothetical protein
MRSLTVYSDLRAAPVLGTASFVRYKEYRTYITVFPDMLRCPFQFCCIRSAFHLMPSIMVPLGGVCQVTDEDPTLSATDVTTLRRVHSRRLASHAVALCMAELLPCLIG